MGVREWRADIKEDCATAEMFHRVMSWSKLRAPQNLRRWVVSLALVQSGSRERKLCTDMDSSDVTLDVSHAEMSWLKTTAAMNLPTGA